METRTIFKLLKSSLALFVVLLFLGVSGCGPKVEVKQELNVLRYIRPFGFNTANLFLYCPELVNEQEAIASILKESGGDVLRFPGGTTANFYHPQLPGYGYTLEDLELLNASRMQEHMAQVVKAETKQLGAYGIEENFIHAFAKLAVHTDQKVLYVANLLSGTLQETLMALEILSSNGVGLEGVELGNEYYLKAYAKAFPTVEDYLMEAERYTEAIRQVYPDLAISVVAAPVADMKAVSTRDKEWNSTLSTYRFYDALSVHFYPYGDRSIKQTLTPCSFDEAIKMGFEQPKAALERYAALFPEKEVWITEWNVAGGPKWCNNSVAHAFFITLMQEVLSSEPQVTCSIYHTLVSKASEGFNAYRPDKESGLAAQPNAGALALFLKLEGHLKSKGQQWGRSLQVMNESCFYLSYTHEEEALKAVIVYHYGTESVTLQNDLKGASQAFELNTESLANGSLLQELSLSNTIEGEGIYLLLFD